MKIFMAIGLLAFSLTNSHASCRDQLKQVVDEQKAVLIGAGIISVPGAIVAPFTGGVSLLVSGAFMGGLSLRYSIKTHNTRGLIKLIDQSHACSGNKIEKLYSRYADNNPSAISITEFCQKIQASNNNGSLCEVTTKPSKQKVIESIKI